MTLCIIRYTPRRPLQVPLKLVQRTFKLLIDIDMHLLIERGIRGQISIITGRMVKVFRINADPVTPKCYILYI